MKNEERRKQQEETAEHDGSKESIVHVHKRVYNRYYCDLLHGPKAVMAFPVPSHLPRRANPQDVTSKILSTMDEATNKSLTASLAKSWLEELDTTIHSTKVLINYFPRKSTVMADESCSRKEFMTVFTPIYPNLNDNCRRRFPCRHDYIHW